MPELQDSLFNNSRRVEHTQFVTNPETNIPQARKWTGLATRLHVQYPFGTRFKVDGFLMTRTDNEAKEFDLSPTVVRLKYHPHPTDKRPPNVVDYVFYDREEIPPSMHILHEGKTDDRTQLEVSLARLILVRGSYAPAILHANTEQLEREYMTNLRTGSGQRPAVLPSIGLPMNSVGPIPDYGFWHIR